MSENNKKITNHEVKDWNVEIQEDGSVKVWQQIEMEYTQDYRDFLSDFREMQENVKKMEEAMTEERINQIKEDKKKQEEEIEQLRPLVEQAEQKAKEYYERQKKESMLNNIKSELQKNMSDINTAYMASVWDNVQENESELMDKLTAEEKEKFQKIKIRQVQTEKANKRKKN